MNDILNFISSHEEAIMGIISPFVWEFMARKKITQRDYSIINLIKRLFDAIPNNAPDGQLHK
jgi:hypothetical protein